MVDVGPSNLKTILAQHGSLDPARAVRVVRGVAAAIDEVYANKHPHRPVSTDTILVTDDDAVFLADAGRTTPSADQTRSLVTNTEATYRADIHALALLLHECLTGSRPDPSAYPPRPSQQRPGIPVGFDAVIARGLADSDDRYRTAGEFAAAAGGALPPPSEALGPDASRPSQAATRSFAIPEPRHPASPPYPQPSQWIPVQVRSPTVSYPHSRPVQLPAPPPQGRPRRRLGPVIAAVAIVGTVIAGAIAIPRVIHRGSPAGPATPAVSSRHTYTAHPTELPFPDLYPTKDIAVDGAGNVYVLAAALSASDRGMFESEPTKLWKLAPGAKSATQVDIPGVNFRFVTDLTVDKAGNIFYCDGAQVYLLEAGKTSLIRLPFRGFSTISAVAVDQAGNTYAAGALMSDEAGIKYGVKKLVPGESRPTDLSFSNLYQPHGVAVDKDGNVYVSARTKGTGKGQFLKLPVGSTVATALPIPGLMDPNNIALDNAGDIFVGDSFGKGFFHLPPTGDPVMVPLGAYSAGVAADSAGTVYILTSAQSDRSDKIVKGGQVLKVAPDR